jgi:hypothetical protein
MEELDARNLIAHLNRKWGENRACPMCGGNDWNVQPSMFQLLQFAQGSLVVGGPVIPVVPIICTTCGNTILINAIIADILKPPRQAPHVEKKS